MDEQQLRRERQDRVLSMRSFIVLKRFRRNPDDSK